MRPAVHLVVSCTERKRAVVPKELQLRSVGARGAVTRAALWWETLARAAAAARHPAVELYCGEHFVQARGSFAVLRRRWPPAALWIVSAGYGLVSAKAMLAPYSATFASGSPDSVDADHRGGPSRASQHQAWWAALAGYPGPEAGAPRSLRQLVGADTRDVLLVVAAPHYIRAMRIDLLAARSALMTPEQCIVVSNRELLKDAELAPNLIAVDERCQTVVGGTMVGLNARVAHRLLVECGSERISVSNLQESYEAMVSDAERPPKHNRERMGDEAVLTFLRAALMHDPKVGWVLLLRALRGKGRACEQGRFRELHKRAREEVAPAGQQGLKFDRD